MSIHITKKTMVLDYEVTGPFGDVLAQFVATDDEMTCPESLQLRYEDWVDMGSPQRVTVAIEPGDKLNP